MPTIRTRAAKGAALTHNEVDANFKRTARQVTTTGSILVSDNRGTVEGNHASVGITLTLPTVAAAGAVEPGDFIVRVTNINAAVVSVDGSTTETINGSTDAITLGRWESATFELDSAGAGWVTTSRVGDLGDVDIADGTVSGTLGVTGVLTASGGVVGDVTGDVTGNAGTVTINADLTGAITSTGNATSLGSFSSTNLRGALTDETGTGAAVFATSPTLVTPALGTPSALVATNASGTAASLRVGAVTVNAITGETDIGDAIADADELLISDGGALRRSDMSRVKTYIASSANTWNGNQTFNDELILNAGYSEDAGQYAASTGTRDLDVSLATYFYPSADLGTASITFTFSNPAASGRISSFTLELLGADGATLTWPASVAWPNGDTEPTWTAGTDIVSFVTRDGGTTWRGYLGGLDF